MSDAGESGGSTQRVEVSVLMECSVFRHGQWTVPTWRAVGVLEGRHGDAARERVHVAGEVEQYIWRGLALTLHRDGAESYWYNLTGRSPSLFVVCREGEDGMRPVLVTADHDKAGAHMEADDKVHAVPIPPAILERLERFVIANYRPEPRRKRKRTNWEHGDAQDPGTAGGDA
jgi:Protein of unknown function (DUF3305)